jgi:8-oxo-dGTP diphosphatase
MKKFTVGFLFTPDLQKVLLIHKLAPAWQKGKLNGLGGKIEPGEGAVPCFIREIEEESGIILEKKQVRLMGTLKGIDWQVYVFGAIYHGELFEAKVHEKEKIEWFEVAHLSDKCVPNLFWSIPFTRNELQNKLGNSFEVKEVKFDTGLL